MIYNLTNDEILSLQLKQKDIQLAQQAFSLEIYTIAERGGFSASKAIISTDSSGRTVIIVHDPPEAVGVKESEHQS